MSYVSDANEQQYDKMRFILMVTYSIRVYGSD